MVDALSINQIIDITMSIEPDMIVYKNKATKKPVFKTIANHSDHGLHETDIALNLHTGTHIDFPLHMIENGKTSNTEDLSRLITPCKVFDMTQVNDKITDDDLRTLDIHSNDFIIFKTKNSYDQVFNLEFISLATSGASYLKEIGIKGVGIDGLGIERGNKKYETHRTLLGSDIIILEGLVLKDVESGHYQLIALPMKIADVEASLVRAVLLK